MTYHGRFAELVTGSLSGQESEAHERPDRLGSYPLTSVLVAAEGGDELGHVDHGSDMIVIDTCRHAIMEKFRSWCSLSALSMEWKNPAIQSGINAAVQTYHTDPAPIVLGSLRSQGSQTYNQCGDYFPAR